MLFIKYIWVSFLVLLLTGCGTDDEPPSCSTLISRNWTVEEYTIGGQNEDAQNVRVTFNSTDYTLLLPQITSFGSNGSWESNESCSQITLTDGSGEELIMNSDLSTENAMTLTFSYANFKRESYEYRIVLAGS